MKVTRTLARALAAGASLLAAGMVWAADPLLMLQTGHAQRVTALTVDPLGQWMATGGEDGAIGVWDLRTGLRVNSLAGPATAVAALRFDRHEGIGLASLYAATTTTLTWRLDVPAPASGQRMAKAQDLRWLRDAANLDANGDGMEATRFAVAGVDGFDVWTAATAQRPWRYRRAGSLFTDIAVGPGGRQVATLAQSGTLTLWTRHAGRRAGYTGRQLDVPRAAVTRMFFDRRGQLLVVSRFDQPSGLSELPAAGPQLQLDLWDAARGTRVSRFTLNHRCTLMPLAFAPAGYIAVAIGPTFTAERAGTLWLGDPAPDCQDTRLGLVVLGPQPRLVTSTLAAGGVTVAGFDHAGSVLGLGFADGTVGTIALPRVLGEQAALSLRRLGAGELQPVTGLALVNGGKALAVAAGKRITTWDAGTGHPRHTVVTDKLATTLAGGPELDRFAGAEEGGMVTIWDGASGLALFRHDFGSRDLRLAMAKDGSQLAVGRAGAVWPRDETTLSILRFPDRQDLARFHLQDFPAITRDVLSLAFSDDGRMLASGHPSENDVSQPTLRLLDSASGRELPSVFAAGRESVRGLAFQPGGSLLGVASALPLFAQQTSFLLWDSTMQQLRPTDADANLNHDVAFSPDGTLAAVSSTITNGAALTLWDTQHGKRVAQLPGHSAEIEALAFNGNNQLLSGARDGTVRLWSLSAKAGTVTPSATLVNVGGGGDWLVAAADGRFDTNNLDSLDVLAWVFPDDPLRAFPAEIFTRALYEPGLFGRQLTCAGQPDCDSPAARPAGIEQLNRTQPRVAIGAVHAGTDPDEVLVEVTVSSAVDLSQRNGKTHSAAYDLRLFRDGRLVGQLPSPAPGGAASGDLTNWRNTNRVADGSHQFRVRLPRAATTSRVAFTAYAFNEDRVKSSTARLLHERAAVPPGPPRPRAYVIAVGVNLFDDPSLVLNYAAKDARDMSAALTALLARLNAYDVVSLTLLSDPAHAGTAQLNQATRANFARVLQLLGGGPETARAALRQVPGIDRGALERLARATPDDVVIVAFSTHGHADHQGRFYLLPEDTGRAAPGQALVPGRLISSADLSDWLRPIDAGHMALIIDACHSAASVATPEFRPGPLGDPGLGQLAYDKGMLILAATQARDVALEVGQLEQGLLTYALVNRGLAPDALHPGRLNADLDGNGALTLREWLRYGVQQVPRLYAAIRTGTLPAVLRDPLVDQSDQQDWLARIAAAGQTPSLFDFQQAGAELTLQRAAR